jgi:hypothetical protein
VEEEDLMKGHREEDKTNKIVIQLSKPRTTTTRRRRISGALRRKIVSNN